jgi:hypothetical protein
MVEVNVLGCFLKPLPPSRMQRKSLLSALKMAVFAPTARAIVTMAVLVTTGERRIMRSA